MIPRRYHQSFLNFLMLLSLSITFILLYNLRTFNNSNIEITITPSIFPAQSSIYFPKKTEKLLMTMSTERNTSTSSDSNNILEVKKTPNSPLPQITSTAKESTTTLSTTPEIISTTEEEPIDKSMIFNMTQTDPRLIKYIRQIHLTPPDYSKSYNLTSVGYHPNDYSNFVKKLFRKKGMHFKGTFIEAGAYDGEAASNSLFLEELGWKGLLIECNPLLLPKLKAKNRKAWIANVCLSTSEKPKQINFTTPVEWPASAKFGAPLTDLEMKKYGIDWMVNKTWLNYEVTSFPLYSVLKATGEFNEIDFLSLDVEGAEIGILKSFPYESFKIKSLIVEVFTFTADEKADLRDFLKGKGYKLVKEAENDDIYVLKSEHFPPTIG